MTEPIAAETPSAVLCQELAAWQATNPTTPSLDFDAVLAAAAALLNGRFAWSVHFTGDGSADFPVAQNVVLLHVSGASLSTVVPNYPEGLGAALAGLLGLRLGEPGKSVLTVGPDAAASAMLDRLIEQSDAAAKQSKGKAKPATETLAAPEPEPPVEVDELMAAADDPELSEADRQTCLAMLKALPADARRSFTIAFRSHFEVDDSVKQVGGCITHEGHRLFVQDFIDEIELQGGHGG
jgi:hypothetical protein